MRNLTFLLLAACAATAFITGSLLDFQQRYTSEVRPRGGADPVNLELLKFYSIEPEDLRLEDPEGFARLADMEFTPERTRLAAEWAYKIRQRIFLRRYGYPYNEQ